MEADSLDRDDETDFWHGVDRVLAKPCKSAGEIDEVLREFLESTVKRQGGLIQHDSDVYQCLVKLLTSSLFEQNAEYIRLQFIHCFLQEEEASSLYIFALFLLVDGQHNEDTFIIMSSEGAFPHVLKLIQSYVNPEHGSSVDLNRVLLDLTYEMARIQRLRTDDLLSVDDSFVTHLFEIINEQNCDLVGDPFHYPVIRVLLVLNEQFLLATNDLLLDGSSMPPPTNRVIKILCKYGNQYKTFGENIILLLNRESETSLQLLVLKFLYLLFTTPPTYEYFYTNDLHVLVDILIRNLYDLPEDHQSLRHTYLRVLFPLLANTQLKYPPHYKRQEVKRLLGVLLRKQLFDDVENTEIAHFEEVDETTRRLVRRCSDIHWLVEEHVHTNNDDTGNPEKKAAAATPDSLAEKKAATDVHTQAPNSPKPHDHAPPVLLETDGTRPLIKVATCPDIAVHSSQAFEDTAGELIMNLPVRSGSVPPVHEPGVRQKPEPPVPRRVAIQNRRMREAAVHRAVGGAPSPDSNHSSPFPPFIRSTPTSAGTTRSTTPEVVVPENRLHRAMSFQPPEPPHPRAHRAATSQPPAVPPPRRSSHSTPHTPDLLARNLRSQQSTYLTPPVPPIPPHFQPNSQSHSPLLPSQKPEPPAARRSHARRLHRQQQQQQHEQHERNGINSHPEVLDSPQFRMLSDKCLSTSPDSTASGETLS